MTRLNITIKDNGKADIVLRLLRELPFVEIEGDIKKAPRRAVKKGKGDLSDLFGIWEARNVSSSDLRKKAWDRN
jgi:hypothetical protein